MPRLVLWFERRSQALGFPPGYLACAPLALLAVWGHHYPAGIDLPQHANLVRLWVELGRGPLEYNVLYRVSAFTPYVLAYAVAYPFAKWWSALAGVKVVLSIAALGTPWSLARWLRAVGGEARLALLGFPLAFGFAYLWGFLSNSLAMPILFGYLASCEAEPEPKSGSIAKHTLASTCWGALLFFCHGVTFGVAALSVSVRMLLRLRASGRAALLRAVHLLPLALLTFGWLWLRERKTSAPSNWWFIDGNRLLTLFSGFFWPQASALWAAVTVTAVVILVASGRPRLNRSAGAWVPFVVALAAFMILPEYMASSYVVGTRCCLYVQGFVLALWLGGTPHERRLERTLALLVAASLVLLNVRLAWFNTELDGFREIAAHVAPRADVQTYLPRLGGGSEAFGPRELSEVPAWVAAESGGLIENDSASYFQMPVQRRFVRFPRRYRYVFARGDERVVRARIGHEFPGAVVAARAERWFLFERAPDVTGSILVVRSAQEWGDLVVDRSTTSAPLSVAGTVFDHGLATQGRSFIRVRSLTGRSTLDGGCGVDDDAPADAVLMCRVRGTDGSIAWASGPMPRGAAARMFSVALDANHEALLETVSTNRNEGNHADWVDLR